jgi:hypothetical protein
MNIARTAAPAARRPIAALTAVASVLLSSALLAACGGGNGVGGAGTGSGNGLGAGRATVSGISAGAVTGKGSTIVNGVRFDDASARVLGDDDSSRSGDDVKVGMQVEVEFNAASCSASDPTGATTPTCKADSIRFGDNSLLGPVSGWGAVAGSLGSFSVLGQKIATTASTTVKFENSTTVLADGAIVEVYGSWDKSTGITTATRIEVKAAGFAGLPASVKFFRLRGQLDARAGTIGGVAVDLGGVNTTGLDGQLVRARLTPAAGAPFAVSQLKSAVRKLDDRGSARTELEGSIADWLYAADSRSATFTLGGVKVSLTVSNDAGSSLTAVLLADLDAALAVLPAVPVRVGVKGTVGADGVLVASLLSLEDDTGGSAGNSSGNSGNSGKAGGNTSLGKFELHGQIGMVDAVKHSFTLRDETILVDAATQFASSGLNEAGLVAGLKVEVKGKRSAGGTAIVATRIKLDK